MVVAVVVTTEVVVAGAGAEVEFEADFVVEIAEAVVVVADFEDEVGLTFVYN